METKQINEFRAELKKIVEVYAAFGLISISAKQVTAGDYKGRYRFTTWVSQVFKINHPN